MSCSKDECLATVHLDAYDEYAKVLRTWFVAYGIGGPVLFLTQQHIASIIKDSPYALFIVCLFLGGVIFQILLALTNKTINWIMYFVNSEKDEVQKRKESGYYKVAELLSECYWIDIVIDILTVLCFGFATLLVLLMFI